MTVNFCRALGASSHNTWSKVTSKTGDDIRVASRKNLNDPGEPLGVILCAVSSVWLPVSHNLLFDFLRDENRRNEVCNNILFQEKNFSSPSMVLFKFYIYIYILILVNYVHFSSGISCQMEVPLNPLLT